MIHEIPDDFEHGASGSNGEQRSPGGSHSNSEVLADRTLNEVGDERAGEQLVQQCCRDCGFNMAVALNALAWADGAIHSGTKLRELPALLEQCMAAAQLKAKEATQFILWFMESADLPRSELGHAEPGAAGDMARMKACLLKIPRYVFMHPTPIRVFAILFALGEQVPFLDDIIGYKTPAGFAKEINVHREAVNKVVLEVQKEFGLPQRHGQRSLKARMNMHVARVKQLKGTAKS